ncbi:uncharacterized protein LOC135841303 isoform X2 [Planococcus citri]|uniref:uncharacterized protein LOC135841303 isoform X2 n=1 Tax=Planococcus citri TaxID=170843 RepID=UPI0031F8BB34
MLQPIRELLIVGTVINLSSAEIDSDAVSQVRFVQYQPIIAKPRKPASDNEAKSKELHAAETGHYSNSLEKPNLQRNTENDEENLSVPKNYAFSYEVRDRNSGDDFSHTQAHNGQATKGEYRVKLPDGRNQVVTYTADNDGYKANIQYDSQTAQESSNNGVYISKAFSDDFLSSKHPKQQTTNFDKDAFDFDSLRKDKPSLFSSSKFGSFNFPSSTRKPASYETTENIDEELFPYSKKLLDDVNYLLQYVTPTIESNNRGKEKISIDFSRGRFLNDDPHFKNTFKNEPSPKDKFQLPANFPYQFTKFEEPRFEKLSFNEPNYDDHTFIEPSLMGQKHEDDKFHRLKFQSPKKEVQNIANQLFSGSQFEEQRSSLPSSGEKYFETQPIQRTNFKNDLKNPNAPESKEHQFDSSNFPSLRTNNAPKPAEEIKIGPSGSNNFKFDDSNLKFRESRIKEQPNSEIITSQQNPSFEEDAYKLPKFDATLFENGHFEQVKYDAPKFDPKSFENGNFEQAKYEVPKFDPKSYENNNFDKSNYQTPKFDPKSYENNNFDKSNYQTPKFDPKSFENNNFEQANYQTPNYNHFSNSNDQKFRTLTTNEGNPKPNSVEIPQYIHIHRYEASGEDQTNNARPKELIYYNPLQIPVPNSIAYMEQGSYNFSNPQLSTLTPSYITMTEHPRVKPTDAPARYLDHTSVPDLALKLNSFDQSKENYFAPTPQTIQTPVLSVSQETPPLGNYENRPNYNYDANDLNPPPSPLASPENFSNSPSFDYDTNKAPFAPPTAPKVTPEPPSEDHNNYENTIGGLPPYFDPRTYSGYFDFLPESGEAEPEHEKQSSPEISKIQNPSSSVENSETPKNELPQYYYDFSTASPSHKYVSSAEVGLSSREEFQPVLDPDHIRNTSSFLASAYLRPLHKERVYIYHNSLPTISAEENHNFSPTTPFVPKQPNKNTADIQIIKSISSTIPPELLKDFDRQLSSPIFARSDDNSDANSEPKQVKVSPESSPRLRSDLVKQLQSTLATKAVPYLKTPTQQKRISR